MNIYDIARLSGVSIATVSRVLNNSPLVSEATKNKILDVIENEGYTPNAFARGLLSGTINAIGIIVPDISDSFMAEAISYFEDGLKSHGYTCIVGSSGFHQEDKEELARYFVSKKVDAIVFIGSTYSGGADDNNATSYIKEIAKTLPVFMVNSHVEGNNIFSIFSDDFEGIYNITEKCIANGKRNIAFLTDSKSFSASRKLDGYIAALKDNKLSISNDLIIETKGKIEYTKSLLLGNTALSTDCIIAVTDTLAVAAIKYAHTIKKSIPGDIWVVGYNNSFLSIACEPEITSIDNHLEDMCNTTIDNIIQVLENKEKVKKTIELKTTLVERRSTEFK